MSDLRQAASFALTTLQGWSARDHWLWPESALAQAKQNTAEAIPLLEAALAEPEPEGPTRRQLMILADDMGMTSVGDAAEYAREVLARWGNHPGSPDSSTPQPVPVSERLPGPGDCDTEGRCWAWKLDDEDDAWHLELQEWVNSPWTTHWLPAHTLPLPF